ncbi:hypothetical protein J6TS7_00810 [Paenibacillus dendritiformis]|nr:hypothetical protein J6TS7_00810 [Paenibacillus dendritiformis]
MKILEKERKYEKNLVVLSVVSVIAAGFYFFPSKMSAIDVCGVMKDCDVPNPVCLPTNPLATCPWSYENSTR